MNLGVGLDGVTGPGALSVPHSNVTNTRLCSGIKKVVVGVRVWNFPGFELELGAFRMGLLSFFAKSGNCGSQDGVHSLHIGSWKTMASLRGV